MSSSRRRGELNSKLHMDRQPTVARITDPSLPAGKRREIDNVMKKARAHNTNDYWDKKLIEAEEKDPNRWRHTGYKKMYIQGDSSSGESDRERERERERERYNLKSSVGRGINLSGPTTAQQRYGRSRSPRSRSHSRLRKASPITPPIRRRSPPLIIDNHSRRISPSVVDCVSRGRLRTSPTHGGLAPRSPDRPMGSGVSRPRSPPELPLRRKSRSPVSRRRSPQPSSSSGGGVNMTTLNKKRSALSRNGNTLPPGKRAQILPRSKRPPSPPPKNSCHSRSNSSMSSCSDDSCSVCSPAHRRRSRSTSLPRSRTLVRPRSPSLKQTRSLQYRSDQTCSSGHVNSRVHSRILSPPSTLSLEKHREDKVVRHTNHDQNLEQLAVDGQVLKTSRSSCHSPLEDPRLKSRPPEPLEPSSSSNAVSIKRKKKPKESRTRIKIEGEKRKKHIVGSSSDSEDSGGSDSESSLPTFTATTRLTLSERFGKMAQWSLDRSNMENMRITKDSAGGAFKVMIEEGLDSPPRRYSYSPAPAGHFPEELATTAPSGMLSWDDVRVRYEYYKSRGYLRDLDLKDYIKWEEWWYKYQEWLKQERYYEFWERQQMQRRRRKKLSIAQRLN